jgi:hypothetical protein
MEVAAMLVYRRHNSHQSTMIDIIKESRSRAGTPFPSISIKRILI